MTHIGDAVTSERPTDAEIETYQADASKWANGFRRMAISLGYSDMDEGWLIGWFANAIERADQFRHPCRPALEPTEPLAARLLKHADDIIGEYPPHVIEDIKAAAELARRHPSTDGGAVKVKDLVWREIGPIGSDVEAETILGTYTLSFDALSAGGASNLWMAGADNDTFTVFNTKAEAKAAAQADFNARIQSALSLQPVRADGWKDVLAERQRQISVEGWTTEHDDTHERGELARAAAAYAIHATVEGVHVFFGDTLWPWAKEWWKPAPIKTGEVKAGRRRNLVKAGALILAEIDRLDRLPTAPGAAS